MQLSLLARCLLQGRALAHVQADGDHVQADGDAAEPDVAEFFQKIAEARLHVFYSDRMSLAEHLCVRCRLHHRGPARLARLHRNGSRARARTSRSGDTHIALVTKWQSWCPGRSRCGVIRRSHGI